MKKEKEKGSRLKTGLVIFGVLIVLGAIGSAFSDDDGENNTNSQNAVQTSNEPSSFDESNQPKESEESENNSSEIPPDESEPKDENPLEFNVMFSDTYQNDVTGNWRLARIAENINIEEYAVDYYNNYFESDSEIHIIINFTLNTTTRITVMGNLLDVSIMEYVDKEEHDAKLACSGVLLKEYHVNIDTGEIEEIQ